MNHGGGDAGDIDDGIAIAIQRGGGGGAEAEEAGLGVEGVIGEDFIAGDEGVEVPAI